MRLSRGNTTVSLSSYGAMIVQAAFDLDGRIVKPFFENWWRDDPRDIDPFIRRLGAEWPCVPFALPSPPEGLPHDWRIDAADSAWNDRIHGYGSHEKWELERVSDHAAVARIDYPAESPVARVSRRVDITDSCEIALTLTIDARRPARIGAGVHPVFALDGAAPGTAQLDIAGRQTAWSFPIDVEPGRGRFVPDQRGAQLNAMREVGGGLVNARKVPLDGNTEDLLLLTETDGAICLVRPDRDYRICVRWNIDDLPCCALWYSNGGRVYPPWDGRVRAIGIEPVAAAFNLGELHNASAATPLARNGVATAITLEPGKPWSTNYTISVTRVDGSCQAEERI